MANYELDIQLKNHAPVVVNFEPLKAELSAALEEIKCKEYTEETIAEAKEDRAKLNKLKTVIDNERKARKNEYLKPLEVFEKQVKELCLIIDEVTTGIGSQLDTFEQKRIEKKKAAIRELFSEIASNYDALDFITLEKIYNPKWENKSVTDKAIATEITEVFEKAAKDLEIISKMPYYFEAKETYKLSLDLNKAIAEGERIAQIQEAKRQAVLRKAQEEVETEVTSKYLPEAEPTYVFAFKCKATKSQAIALKDFCTRNGIELQKI